MEVESLYAKSVRGTVEGSHHLIEHLTYFYDPARQHNSLTRRTCLPRWPMKPANYTYDASGNLISGNPRRGLFTGSYTALY